jgi:hypothetical protein
MAEVRSCASDGTMASTPQLKFNALGHPFPPTQNLGRFQTSLLCWGFSNFQCLVHRHQPLFSPQALCV